jgi:hypothetical protein
MMDPDADDHAPPKFNSAEIDSDDLDGDAPDRIVAAHERRVRVLAPALERFIGRMGVRPEPGGGAEKPHALLDFPMDDLQS